MNFSDRFKRLETHDPAPIPKDASDRRGYVGGSRGADGRGGVGVEMSMQFHPAANLFPMMTKEELRKLSEDIKERGLIDPIITCDGMVLDGRNRYRACITVGVEPRFEKWDGRGGSPTVFSVSKNLNRRHLTLGQQAAIAAEMMPLLREEARKRQATLNHLNRKPSQDDLLVAPVPQVESEAAIGDEQPCGKARALAAQAVGIGERSVQYADTVRKLDPKAFERLKSGETAPKTEYKKLKRAGLIPPKEEREKPSDKGKGKKKPTLTGAKLAQSQKAAGKRLSEAVAVLEATSRAIASVEVGHALAGLRRDEVMELRRALASIHTNLKELRKKLEDCINGEKNGRIGEDTGEGLEDSPESAEITHSVEDEAD